MTDVDSEREIVKRNREELKHQEDSLRALYDEEARKVCPFNIGDEIEYELGKRGKVDEIFFPFEYSRPPEEQAPEHWAVTGRKLNKDGKFGKKNFQAVSSRTHIIEGMLCRRRTVPEILGIE